MFFDGQWARIGKRIGICFPKDWNKGLNRPKRKPRSSVRKRGPVSGSLTRWLELRQLFPNQLSTEPESLYVLPPDLISAIDEQIPGFLGRDDLAFERFLAATEDVGFFRQRPIAFRLVRWAGRLGLGDRNLERCAERTSAEIDRMLREQLILAKLGDAQIQSVESRREDVRLQIQERQEGYLAWLVTNIEFRRELEQLRRVWDQEREQSADLPQLPLEFLGQRRTRPEPDQGDSAATAIRFLWKWGLQGLESWDLPVPQSPALTGPNLYSLTDQEESGVVLFVPWYFLVNRDMGLEALIDQHRLEHPQRHLASWIRGRDTRKFGTGRFSLMWQLYVLLELVLRPRYADRLNRNLGRLDLAIATYLCPHEDRRAVGRVDRLAENVRRIRLELNKRLRRIN